MDKGPLLLLVAAGLIIYTGTRVKNYFDDDEFKGYKDKMAPELLYKLNAFRQLWGAPVNVSPDKDAVGRTYGSGQHNVELWGEVRAIDVIPEGMNTTDDMRRALDIAKRVGFTGIGLYDGAWRPRIHLDVRADRTPSNPALWGDVAGRTVPIEDMLA